jgi:hypothetical protein
MVTLDELVGEVMDALGLFERKALDAEDPYENVADVDLAIDRRVELHEQLRRIWTMVSELPPNHRKALLLNLRDRDGGLIGTLQASGVVSMQGIAGALEMTMDELSRIWNTLPWHDLKIAEHLGLHRQQIINLRQSARAKLLRGEKQR